MVVGVDIGGSGIRAAVVQQGQIVGPVHRVDLDDRRVAAVVDGVGTLVGRCGRPAAVGVGVPGFVAEGVVLGSPNFPGWEGVDLAGALTDRLGVTVTVCNDANMAALGAWADGEARDLVLLTLGTGVGGGVVTGGRLLVGAGGTGAELGHIHVGGARPCGCGGRGCLETFVGTSGLVAEASRRDLHAVDGEAVVSLAESGHPTARALLDEAAVHLGWGLVTLVNLFNPDEIRIVGGLARAREWLAPAESQLARHGIPPSVERVRITWGGRAESLAIVGAAAWAQQHRGSTAG